MKLSRRARRQVTSTAVIRSWRSKDGRYRVAEIKSLLGLPTIYMALERLPNGNESLLGRKRTLEAALRCLPP